MLNGSWVLLVHACMLSTISGNMLESAMSSLALHQILRAVHACGRALLKKKQTLERHMTAQEAAEVLLFCFTDVHGPVAETSAADVAPDPAAPAAADQQEAPDPVSGVLPLGCCHFGHAPCVDQKLPSNIPANLHAPRAIVTL